MLAANVTSKNVTRSSTDTPEHKHTWGVTMGQKIFHADGAGARPDGKGSGYAWIRIATGKQRIEQMDGLTSNEAEYQAVLAVLRYVAPESSVLIKTDSALVVEQFNGRWKVREERLRELLEEVRAVVKEKKLDLEIWWIPRRQNIAGTLLETG
jgi:ribonuclease HI